VAALTFVDESLNSVDDCIFLVTLGVTWQNSPTVRHSRGATCRLRMGIPNVGMERAIHGSSR